MNVTSGSCGTGCGGLYRFGPTPIRLGSTVPLNRAQMKPPLAFLLLWSFVLCDFHADCFKAGWEMQIEWTPGDRCSQNKPEWERFAVKMQAWASFYSLFCCCFSLYPLGVIFQEKNVQHFLVQAFWLLLFYDLMWLHTVYITSDFEGLSGHTENLTWRLFLQLQDTETFFKVLTFL